MSGKLDALSPSGSVIPTGKKFRKRDAAFNGCVATLETINETTDVFPPLKSAASLVLELIAVIRSFHENKSAWIEFAHEITRLVKIIEEGISDDPSAALKAKLEHHSRTTTSTFAQILEEVKGLGHRGIGARILNWKADKDKITEDRRRLGIQQDELALRAHVATLAMHDSFRGANRPPAYEILHSESNASTSQTLDRKPQELSFPACYRIISVLSGKAAQPIFAQLPPHSHTMPVVVQNPSSNLCQVWRIEDTSYGKTIRNEASKLYASTLDTDTWGNSRLLVAPEPTYWNIAVDVWSRMKAVSGISILLWSNYYGANNQKGENQAWILELVPQNDTSSTSMQVEAA
ncbi:hypothetical protein SISNIDRAFT_470514 [Sistotremastrum niveocremeum HHB9708]|uniref:Uncharacterized protein n=1 Tax=Sistotremastrum niveocremeum HHB9708 TaxID=1314777 RepID=A0A164NU80_9AGAM|nr:hypothetical protein SISNIDRAFT_470514 [Sistotremastrum niveocremeum HHB9708]